jgi:CheY-like chemotaxis protein
LEALILDASALDGNGTRVALFRLFTKLWNSVPLNENKEAVDPSSAPEQRVTGLTPLPRQAFLLLTLERFSEGDAASILGCDVMALRQLVEEAGRELAAEIATDVLIIEDETFIALDLEALIKELGHRVIGIARTHAEAIKLAKIKAPGLILSDIKLADGSSGMEAVQELLRSVEVPVVFITAYPERLLTGNRPEPTFLISKPFEPAMVSAIASQALFFQRNARRSDSHVAA